LARFSMDHETRKPIHSYLAWQCQGAMDTCLYVVEI
jgi:hypothetical protein